MSDIMKTAKIDFVNEVKTCLRKYATFSGRARRTEFWYFQLFYFVVGFIAMSLDDLLFSGLAIEPLNMLTFFALIVPQLAVAARRLHDINRSGWWQLLAFTVIGLVLLIYWFCQKGHSGDNRFGADPLGHAPAMDANS